LQELPAALIDNLQMLQAGARFRRGDRLRIRVVTGCLSGPKPHRLTSGPTVISIAPCVLAPIRSDRVTISAIASLTGQGRVSARG
jgi:hypothetical protein